MISVNGTILPGSAFKETIFPQARKALVEFWGSEEIVDQPEIIVDLGPDSISRINRIGTKSLLQMAQALYSFGYIDSVALWLLGTK